MATDLRNLPAFLSNDADFRSWGSGIHAQLTACGLVNTTDTGQIDFTTVARPAANTLAGYKVYRFDDALQATKPIFIKLEYGVGSTQDKPATQIRIGSTTNGAGTLGGQVMSSAYLLATASSKTAGAVLPSYCSGDGSRIALVTHLDSAAVSYHTGIFIDRARDAAGAPVSAAGIFYSFTQSSSREYRVIPYTGSLPSAGSSGAGLPSVPIAATSGGYMTVFGVDVAMSPYFATFGRLYPLIALANYLHIDVGELVSFTADWMGATRTWIPLGDGGPQGHSSTLCTAMLWE